MASSSSNLPRPRRRPPGTLRRSPRSHVGTRVAAGLAATLLLTSCAVGEPDPGDDPGGHGDSTPAGTDGPDGPRYARYVALGDSFAALGPLAAPTTGPPDCHRSTRNYPSLVDERPDVGELVDVTCGGAETDDMTGRQIPATPPQLDALTPDTDLVTLSIGGNDIGFGAIAECVATQPRVDAGAPCRARLEVDVAGALGDLGARLDAVYDGIRDRSPDARVVATAYLPLVPAHGGCDFVSRMSPGDVTWTRHVTEQINQAVTGAAERAGATVVLPDDAQDRSACADPDVRYTDFTGLETGSHPMHPTAAGHEAMAAAVGEVL